MEPEVDVLQESEFHAHWAPFKALQGAAADLFYN